jgi:hypothetical protein
MTLSVVYLGHVFFAILLWRWLMVPPPSYGNALCVRVTDLSDMFDAPPPPVIEKEIFSRNRSLPMPRLLSITARCCINNIDQFPQVGWWHAIVANFNWYLGSVIVKSGTTKLVVPSYRYCVQSVRRPCGLLILVVAILANSGKSLIQSHLDPTWHHLQSAPALA